MGPSRVEPRAVQGDPLLLLDTFWTLVSVTGTDVLSLQVHIYHHFINSTFRVVGRKLQDHEVGKDFEKFSQHPESLLFTGGDKLRDTQGSEIQPGHAHLPPVAGQQAGVRPQLLQQG